MKIINKTGYQTRDLRAIAVRVAREELDPDKAKRMTVYFDHRRGTGGRISGHAWINGNSIHVKIDRCAYVRGVAAVIAHEFAHARGLTHDKMRGNRRYHFSDAAAWDGYETMPLRAKVEKAKPAPDEKRAAKLKNAQAKVIEWTRKRDRAERALNKWMRIAGRIERQR